MRSNYKRLGNYIKEVNNRNVDLKVKTLLGINIEKYFMPSVANIVGTDMSTYKVVKKGQFACNRMHVGRDYRLPVALSDKEEDFIVSPAYDVFEIIDTAELLPEYLMMWFSRKEFDRNAWFYTDADVRGGLPRKSVVDMQLPVPHPDKQKEIVKEYNTIVNRINLNNQLIQKLEETAQAVYKQWFVDFEFPDEDGQPYKSSGGEMVWNEEMGKEVPKGWDYNNIGSVSSIRAGGDKPDTFSIFPTPHINVPVFSNSSVKKGLLGFTSEAVIFQKSITVSARGAIIGYTELRFVPFFPVVRLIVITPNNGFFLNYLYECIKRFKYDESGSAQGQLTVPEISSFKIILPGINLLEKYQRISFKVSSIHLHKELEDEKLMLLKELLLSKLVTILNYAK